MRAIRASITQWQITPTTPATSPRKTSIAASAKPGASIGIGTLSPWFAIPRNIISSTNDAPSSPISGPPSLRAETKADPPDSRRPGSTFNAVSAIAAMAARTSARP